MMQARDLKMSIDTMANGQESQASQITMRLNDQLEQLTRCKKALWTAVDRLAGSSLTKSSEPPEMESLHPEGFIPHLADQLQRLENLTNSIQLSVERLEEAV